MPWYLNPDYDTYEDARTLFEWDFPETFNMAWDLVKKHDDPRGTVAVFQGYPDGRQKTLTFHDMDILSNRLANQLEDRGVEKGDRVAIALPQKYQTLASHLAVWKLGAISVPLTVQFGEDALEYRLSDSEAKVAIYDDSIAETMEAVTDECPSLESLIVVDGESQGTVETFEEIISGAARDFTMAETHRDDPAIILYTSGSTGDPKGVLHGHQLWASYAPSMYAVWDLDVLDKTVIWTSTDFAWVGALGWVLPMWHFGRPIVCYPMGGFDSESAFEVLEEFNVTNTFLPPTAIRMMMEVDAPADTYELDDLEMVATGGEPVTPEVIDWVTNELEDVRINEMYGQTEATTFIGDCRPWFEPKLGTIGKPGPGHDVAILDPETGEEMPLGEPGEIAIKRDDPVVFQEYWNKPELTEETKQGDWHLTGDIGMADEEGYVAFSSRADDVIITSGYRVSPREVESAILQHDDVEEVAVIGIPDETRGKVIKAFVQPREGVDGDDDLREEIQTLVRDDLAKYEYPREIELMTELPTTTTGKIQKQDLRKREGIE